MKTWHRAEFFVVALAIFCAVYWALGGFQP